MGFKIGDKVKLKRNSGFKGQLFKGDIGKITALGTHSLIATVTNNKGSIKINVGGLMLNPRIEKWEGLI